MANSSAKKLVKANAARLNRLRLTILVPNLAFLLVRVILRRSTFDTFYLIAWLGLIVAQALPFYLLWTAARPHYFDDGSLRHGGEDISASGLLEYAHDLIYVNALVQMALLLTKWALLLLAVVPIYGIYAACFAARSQDPAGADDDDTAFNEYAGMSRKERRKAEREARKQR